jgi:hypothetical protein
MWGYIVRGIVGLLFCGAVVGWYLIPDSFFVEYSDAQTEQIVKRDQAVIEQNRKEAEERAQQQAQENTDQEQKERENEEIEESVKQPVPFVVQAPHAQWDDPQYQDACEEASMVMAWGWIEGERHISKNDAEEQIEAIFDEEEAMFGGAIDTSAADTARFFGAYYKHPVDVREGIVMEDIYSILADDGIVLAPTNGKMLGNPNFSNGGPERHMVVVIGYDRENREFITNDPGTRVGRGYKYKDTTLYNAIRDYETGTKEEITAVHKNVIVITK